MQCGNRVPLISGIYSAIRHGRGKPWSQDYDLPGCEACSLPDGYQPFEEFSTLKMEAADSSEMLVPNYRNTRRHIPVHCKFDTHTHIQHTKGSWSECRHTVKPI
jgi:hypothetical protein